MKFTGDRPLLSIIIPAYNAEKRLPDSLKEIIDFANRQPFGIEIMVVDDGSEDGTATLIDEFRGRYPFVSKHKVTGIGLLLSPFPHICPMNA